VYVNDPQRRATARIVRRRHRLNGVNFAISSRHDQHPRPCLAYLQNSGADPRARPPALSGAHLRLNGKRPAVIDVQGRAGADVLGGAVRVQALPAQHEYHLRHYVPVRRSAARPRSRLCPPTTQAICTIYPTAKNPGRCEPLERDHRRRMFAARTSRGSALSVALLLGRGLPLWMRRRREFAAVAGPFTPPRRRVASGVYLGA